MRTQTPGQTNRLFVLAVTQVVSVMLLLLILWLLLEPLPPFPFDAVWLFVWMGLCYFPCIAIHELSHFAVAKMVGFTLKGLIVGPLLFRQAGDGWKLGATFIHPYGGITLAHPRDDARLVARLRIFLAAGSLANLLTAAMAYVALLLTPALQNQAAGPALTAFFLVSMGLGYTNLVPRVGLRFSSLITDGDGLFHLFGKKAEEWGGRISVLLALNAGVPPRDWLESWITPRGSEKSGDLTDDFLRSANAYYAWLDRGRLAEATAAYHILFDLLPQLPKSMQAIFACELAFFQAHHLKQAEQAKETLPFTAGTPSHRRGMPDLGTQDRALAALALAEGNHAEAAEFIERGLRKAEKASRGFQSSAAAFEIASLERLQQSLQPVQDRAIGHMLPALPNS